MGGDTAFTDSLLFAMALKTTLPPQSVTQYGDLDHGAVLRELLVERNESGRFVSIVGLEG